MARKDQRGGVEIKWQRNVLMRRSLVNLAEYLSSFGNTEELYLIYSLNMEREVCGWERGWATRRRPRPNSNGPRSVKAEERCPRNDRAAGERRDARWREEGLPGAPTEETCPMGASRGTLCALGTPKSFCGITGSPHMLWGFILQKSGKEVNLVQTLGREGGIRPSFL